MSTQEPATRVCRECRQELAIENFSIVNSSRAKTYRRNTCIECRKKYVRQIRKTNRSKYTKRQKSRRQFRNRLYRDMVRLLFELNQKGVLPPHGIALLHDLKAKVTSSGNTEVTLPAPQPAEANPVVSEMPRPEQPGIAVAPLDQPAG